MKTSRNGLAWLWLSALVILLDQASKLAIMARFAAYRDEYVVTPFFSLVHWLNTGAAFSLFADQDGWQRGFFILLALVASGVILTLLRKPHDSRLFHPALALILGGAIGNLVDRIAYGHVVDFLLFHWQGHIFPAFNLADSAITLGAGLLILDSFRDGKRSGN